MTALRSDRIDAFLARPDPHRPVVLIYGPDAGLVRERVEALLGNAGKDAADPFSVVALDGDAIASDPARLADEAHTLALFGGRRLVHVRAGGRNIADAVAPLLHTPPQDALVVIEAGELRKGAPLRRLLEPAKAAAVIPCYSDSAQDVARLIDRTFAEAGTAIEPEARDALVGLLGADRMATRSELDKLLVYAGDAKRISFDDIRAVVADASALALDELLDTASAGEPDAALAALTRARAAGMSSAAILSAAVRHVAMLHRLSLRLERGDSPAAVVADPGQRIHFRRQPRVRRALGRFGADALAATLAGLGASTLAARRTPALADVIAEREILALARGVRRRGV